jgi:acyl-[acyl-carrier-protein]-phospholipid O-acyltransferase / long-chain-fatty-acid--[acyl-carrier-protein] ligase
MAENQFALLRKRHFLPLFITQALGAFNDNVFKNGILFLVTFVLADQSGLNAPLLVAIAGGIFIFPFFLFSATAGQLAEKFDKVMLIRLLKLTELGLMIAAAAGFVLQSVSYLMVLLFLMGTQSAFFGPLKYSILPELLKPRELLGGNGMVQAGTFLAILLGTITGKVVLEENGAMLVSLLIVAVAMAGWLASRFIPPRGPMVPDLKVDYNVFTSTWEMLRYARSQKGIFLIILAISWFWLVGATFLTEVTPFAKDVLGGDQNLATLLLVLFSIGVALGSLLCNSMLKGEVHATFVPLGALGMTLFALDLYFTSRGFSQAGASHLTVSEFLGTFRGWRVLVDFLFIAIAGGIYIVPLNTLLQYHSNAGHRARNIAANNIFNALFMVISALGTALLVSLQLTIPQIFLVIALCNGLVAIYITRLLPGALARAFVAWLLQMFYRVEVTGLKHIAEAGERVLIVSNHQSFLDAALIAAYVPEDLTFAIDTYVAKNRLVKFFLSMAKTIPIDPVNPLSTRTLIDAVKRGEKVVIFPEGRITVTGALMKIFEGPGMVADKARAKIVPVRLDGAQYTPFSRLAGKVKIRWFPKIHVHFLPPTTLDIPAAMRSRERRSWAGRRLTELMTNMMFETSDYRRTLFHSLIDARDIHGSSHIVLEDINRQPVSYRKLLIGSFALGRAMAKETAAGEHVGLLLPNSVAAATAFFGLHACGRIPAMLNFSTGSHNLVSGCRTAEVKRVYTSRRFIEEGGFAELAEAIEAAGMRLLYLEDVAAGIGLRGKVLGMLSGIAPRLAYLMSCNNRDAQDPAVILFTSGTEGHPKGVVLSHVNLQANRFQVAAMIDFGPRDIVFNVLPMFHSFGLTCGTLLPLLSGLKIFLYPSPLHYRIVPELVYATNATMMFGTDTFMAGYARFANPYDFYSLRYVFTGAEKLRDETRRAWSEQFGVRIFEGYGATETSPILSLNSPMYNQTGSVGKFVPGLEYRLQQVPGIAAGGRLEVRAPNVMLGYLLAEAPGELQPPPGGWYDTGDIVTIDDLGFITIQGRAKRFAKIAGEMVSLAAVEAMAAELWPHHQHGVVAIPDPKKGEQLVLVSSNPDASREALSGWAREHGVAAIAVPARILQVSELPMLGSGKTDLRALKQLVEERH